MKIFRSLSLALLLLAAPAAGQVVDVVFPGYRVFVAATDSTISTHQTYHVALERAVNFAIATNRATRIELIGPVRVTVDPAQVPTPDPDPPDDPPVDDDPPVVEDPPGDPADDPDSPSDPPADTTTTPPAPGVWLTQDWAYTSTANMLADPNIDDKRGDTSANGPGIPRPITVSNTPWGGTRALENHFYGPRPVSSQPQVGVEWYIPWEATELWIETWIRFDPNWSVGPGSNLDHKTMFFWASGGPRMGGSLTRWEIKFGPNGNDCVTTIGSSPEFYEVGFVPPLGGWNYDLYTANDATRCRASQRVFGGGWHKVQAHLRMGTSDGMFEAWLDGVKTNDSGPINTYSSGQRFSAISFGANRNAGPSEPMSFYFGPMRLYRARPAGWPN